jgi:hypothetical protein
MRLITATALLLVVYLGYAECKGDRAAIKNEAHKARRAQGIRAYYRETSWFLRVTLHGSAARSTKKEIQVSIKLQKRTCIIAHVLHLPGDAGIAMASVTTLIIEVRTEIKRTELRASPPPDYVADHLANVSAGMEAAVEVIASVNLTTEVTMNVKVEARFEKMILKGKCVSFATLSVMIQTTITITITISFGISTGLSLTAILSSITILVQTLTIITISGNLEEYFILIGGGVLIIGGGSGSGSGGGSGSAESYPGAFGIDLDGLMGTFLWAPPGTDCDAGCMLAGELCDFGNFSAFMGDPELQEMILNATLTPDVDTCAMNDGDNSTDAIPCMTVADGTCAGLDTDMAVCVSADLDDTVMRLCMCTFGADCIQHGKGKGHVQSGGKGKGGTMTCNGVWIHH